MGQEENSKLVMSRRKLTYPDYEGLPKKQRKLIMSQASSQQILSHPYNLLVQDFSLFGEQSPAVAPGLMPWSNQGLAPIAIEVKMEDKQISDRFLWSIYSDDKTGLNVYLSSLLMDADLRPTEDRLQQLRLVVEDQLNGFKRSTAFKTPFTEIPKTTTNVQLFLDKVRMNAFTDEQVAREFAQIYAAEHSLPDAGSVLWQVIDQCVAARVQGGPPTAATSPGGFSDGSSHRAAAEATQ